MPDASAPVRDDAAGHAEGPPEAPDIRLKPVLLSGLFIVVFVALTLAGVRFYRDTVITSPNTEPARTFAGPARVLTTAGIALAVLYVAIPIAPVPAAVAALALSGLAMAVVFPTLSSSTADRVGVEAAGRVVTLQLLVANVAGLGPLQKYLDDPEVEEIWINDPNAASPQVRALQHPLGPHGVRGGET